MGVGRGREGGVLLPSNSQSPAVGREEKGTASKNQGGKLLLNPPGWQDSIGAPHGGAGTS